MNDIKLICFDMDDTLISQNSWYKLNQALGVTTEEDQKMYDSYGRGDLSYSDWIDKLFYLYKERGLATKETIYSALYEFVLKDGANDLITDLQNKGYEIMIISGSFDILVKKVAEILNVKHYKANTELKFNSLDYLDNIVSGGDELHAKLRHLESFCEKLRIPIDQCVCIGDGANDIELFKKTQKGITFKDAPEHVKKEAWHIVNDLSDIKGLL